jgi:hypothetical protein
MNDGLRDQIRQLDPVHPGVPSTHPSHELMEEIMNEHNNNKAPARNRWYAVAGAAAVVVGLAFTIPALSADTSPTTTIAAAPALQLSLGETGGGTSMTSCIMFDTAILADMPVAFEGTVTAVDGDKVTLDVDHWYVGGDASTVELSAPDGLQALIGGVEFVTDGQYLITATDGVVNYCGYSGESTTEYRAAFDEAFGA